MRAPPALALVCLAAGCGAADDVTPAQGGGDPAASFRIPVTFVEIAAGTVEERLSLVGDVESARRALLAFERGGRVAQVEADAGQAVPAGAVLARLDDAALEAELRAARAAAAADRADADYATAELRRARELGDTVAQSERDRWSAESAAREARAARSDAEIGRLDAVLAQGVLHAPFAGTIVARRVTLGSHAAAGATAFELVDLAALEAWLELPAEVAGLARAGDRVTLEAPGGELELPLDAIVPSTEPGARTFRAVARFAGSAAPGLMPGAFVRARLVLRAAAGLVVPVDALLETAGGTALVCAEAGADGAPDTARLVPVRVMARGADGSAAVAPLEPGGLAEGARVVVTGCDNVFPGAPLLLQAHRAARP